MKKRLIGLCLLLILAVSFGSAVYAGIDSDPILKQHSAGHMLSQPLSHNTNLDICDLYNE